MAYDYNEHKKSGQSQIGGRARGGHRSARAKARARSQAKATGRIVRKAGIKHPRMGRLSILRKLLILK